MNNRDPQGRPQPSHLHELSPRERAWLRALRWPAVVAAAALAVVLLARNCGPSPTPAPPSSPTPVATVSTVTVLPTIGPIPPPVFVPSATAVPAGPSATPVLPSAGAGTLCALRGGC